MWVSKHEKAGICTKKQEEEISVFGSVVCGIRREKVS